MTCIKINKNLPWHLRPPPVWHCSHVLDFVLILGCAKIGLCRDCFAQNFFGNVMQNFSVEIMLYETYLVINTLEFILSIKKCLGAHSFKNIP